MFITTITAGSELLVLGTLFTPFLSHQILAFLLFNIYQPKGVSAEIHSVDDGIEMLCELKIEFVRPNSLVVNRHYI